MRCLEDLAMREDAKSFLGRIGPLARSQLATQAAVLLPVVFANASPAAVGTEQPEPPEIPAQAAPIEASPAAGLKISSQSWRRAGLGSNALVTLRCATKMTTRSRTSKLPAPSVVAMAPI